MDKKKIDYIRSRRYPFGVCDIVVFALSIVLIAVLLLTVTGKKGNAVEISYKGGSVILPLDKNDSREIDGHLTVTVQNGKCYVSSADCKNKICVKTGKISRVGESIVCAQNGVVITVIGSSGLAASVG